MFCFMEVVSGGVACNRMLRDALAVLCGTTDTSLVIPPARLCSDNGVMIGW